MTKRWWLYLSLVLLALVVAFYVWYPDEEARSAGGNVTAEPDLSQMRSKSCAQCPEFLIEIKNLRSTPLDIFWVDFEGREVHYATCPPGEVVNQPTSAVDVWILRENGKFVRTIENPAERMTIEVR